MSTYRVLTLQGQDPALQAYLPMIYSDFMKSLRYGNDWYQLIDSGRYYSIYQQVIQQLLSQGETLCRLAVLSEDLDTCLGWSLADSHRFHYVFVKKDYRKQGIGASLVPPHFERVTHLTKIGQAIRRAKFPHLVFDPFL